MNTTEKFGNNARIKLKVCGMKFENNIAEVGDLAPDYMGFIFYEKSPRNFTGKLPFLPPSIQKVGVFVAAPITEVVQTVLAYDLQVVQLHGEEDPQYCQALRNALKKVSNKTAIFKVFSIKDQFDFSRLIPFEQQCDYFLFDTKGPLPGGNGYEFDWTILQDYPSSKPFLLSGGIGRASQEKLEAFFNSSAATFCHAIDVNSQFETTPGCKTVAQLKKFKTALVTMGL